MDDNFGLFTTFLVQLNVMLQLFSINNTLENIRKSLEEK
jgi:hypothetical protein